MGKRRSSSRAGFLKIAARQPRSLAALTLALALGVSGCGGRFLASGAPPEEDAGVVGEVAERGVVGSTPHVRVGVLVGASFALD